MCLACHCFKCCCYRKVNVDLCYVTFTYEVQVIFHSFYLLSLQCLVCSAMLLWSLVMEYIIVDGVDNLIYHAFLIWAFVFVLLWLGGCGANACVHVHVCACAWRPGLDADCPSLLLFTLCFMTVSHWSWSSPVGLTGWPVSSCLCLSHAGIQIMPSHTTLMWMLGNQT